MISMAMITQSIIYDYRDWGYIELKGKMERKNETQGTLFEEWDGGKKLILYTCWINLPLIPMLPFNSLEDKILESVRTINDEIK